MDYCPFPTYLYDQCFTLVTNHQSLRWFMKLDKLNRKFARWALLLQEYNFEVVHRVRTTDVDADRLSCNPSPSDENLTETRWHGDYDQEAVPSWCAAAYLTLFFGATVEVLIQGSDDETDQPQVIANIWEDLPILHKLQQRIFPSSTSAMKRDRIGH